MKSLIARKKLLFIGLILLVLAASISYYLLLTASDKSGLYEGDALPEKEQGTVTTKVIEETTEAYTISFQYPVIRDEESFNQDIEKRVKQLIQTFQNDVVENQKKRALEGKKKSKKERGPSYSLQGNYTVSEATEERVSLLVNVSWYITGEHDAVTALPVNYDRREKKEILLSDLLSQVKLESVALVVGSDLKTRLVDFSEDASLDSATVELLTAATLPKEENYQLFTLKGDTITFYFLPYQKASWSDTTETATLSLSDSRLKE